MTFTRLLNCVGLILLTGWSLQVHAVSEEALLRGVPSLAPMLEEVTPAVVSIRVSKTIPTSNRFFDDEDMPDEVRRYLERLPNFGRNLRQQPFATGAGSGVIVDAQRGFIITNHHVIDSANSIQVQLHDGRTLEARLLGSDASTDVALLEVEAADLVEIDLARVDTVQVGDYVVAIGNPFGIGQTVTSGIVSALGRNGLNNNNYEDFIQTDAAINLGNSGGALVDMEGNLIGINTAIISGNGGSNGIGFAVPVDMVAAVMEHLERDGEVRRGLLGVNIIDANPDVVSALNVNIDAGAVVTNVMPGSAAEAAGIQVSDVIVEIDGRAVESGRALRNIVGLMRRDQEIELVLYRGGERLSLNARIGSASGQAVAEAERPTNRTGLEGTRLRNVNGSQHEFADQGVEVLAIEQRSRAWVAGLREGDVIIEVNRQAIEDLGDFDELLAGSGRFTALTVLREGRRMLFFLS